VVELGETGAVHFKDERRKCLIFSKVVMHKTDTFHYQTAYLSRRTFRV